LIITRNRTIIILLSSARQADAARRGCLSKQFLTQLVIIRLF
jgi:hypothetical protein